MLETKYNHKLVEENKYNNWKEKGYFESGDLSKKPYCIVIPPPNVTGKLHLGHAWDTTLQDIIIRYKRMDGYDALWLPGMDHAAIATEARVVKKLKSQGIDKYEYGREKFLEACWDWTREYGGNIRDQWAKLGLSVDYTKERFTLDEGLSKAVRKVFVDLYNEGLIYRGERIINWDPEALTALSNEEVIYKDDEGAFYHLKYMLEGEDGKYLEVATTRPETLFGDTAVAVNPKDERYKEYIGKNVILPIVNKLIPIVADEHADPEFGTGVVKITPAHDPNDFEVGNRHNLERVVVMHPDATMNENAGKYEGMNRFECREALLKDLEEENLLIKIEKMTHSVGHSERTDAVVEPYLSKQWFVKMRPLADRVLENQKNKDTKVNFVPTRYEKTMNHWMEITYDWCISRQLWWGHQIPAWYKDDEVYVGMEAPEGEGWIQDNDVLDTWFSSALWPFSTLGWPDNTEDLKRYYPNSLMVTAFDIILFWVSRMMFQGVEFTGKMPFNHVLIHGLIRDEQGRKMSKSLGNGIDPMDVINQYGADALRYFLATSSAPGLDFRFSTTKIEASWNFLNKIWNASRFVLMNLPHDFEVKEIDDNKLTLADKWILSKLAYATNKITENLDKYEFANVGTYLTNLIWNDFCSWYIEMSKLSLLNDEISDNTRQVLVYVLKQIVVLLHPFVPFISEEIYQAIPGTKGSINVASWPNVPSKYLDVEIVKEMDSIIEVITNVRNLRNTENIANSVKLKISVFDKSENQRLVKCFNENINYLLKFTNAESFTTLNTKEFGENGRVIAISDGELFISLENAIDVEKELDKLNKELIKVQAGVARGEAMFNNPAFVQKAPAFKIETERKILDDYLSKKASILKRISELEAMKK